jgi:hypothetical protein
VFNSSIHSVRISQVYNFALPELSQHAVVEVPSQYSLALQRHRHLNHPWPPVVGGLQIRALLESRGIQVTIRFLRHIPTAKYKASVRLLGQY